MKFDRGEYHSLLSVVARGLVKIGRIDWFETKIVDSEMARAKMYRSLSSMTTDTSNDYRRTSKA